MGRRHATPTTVTTRRARFDQSPFEALFGVCAIVTGTFNLASRSSIRESNLNSVVPLWWAYGINGAYSLAGALITAGLWRGRTRMEAAGLYLLASFLAINAVVLTQVRGLAAFTSIAFYVAITVASIHRARLVVRLPRVVVT